MADHAGGLVARLVDRGGGKDCLRAQTITEQHDETTAYGSTILVWDGIGEPLKTSDISRNLPPMPRYPTHWRMRASMGRPVAASKLTRVVTISVGLPHTAQTFG
jgi:hypothetical protein